METGRAGGKFHLGERAHLLYYKRVCSRDWKERRFLMKESAMTRRFSFMTQVRGMEYGPGALQDVHAALRQKMEEMTEAEIIESPREYLA